MLKKVLVLAAVAAKLVGIAMLYQGTTVAAEDCLPCQEPCWPSTGCSC